MEAYNDRMLRLLEKFERGEATSLELEELDSWYDSFQKNDTYTDGLSGVQEMMVKEHLFAGIRVRLGIDPVSAPVLRTMSAGHLKLKANWLRFVAAAVLLMVIGAGLYFYNFSGRKSATAVQYAADIAPGKVGATLTLANGKKIRLADAANGEIAKEAGISVTKTADGQLIYQIKENSAEPGKINTLSTARGETYILTLPDKSKVWLNAASSLTYASALIERGTRRVKLIGEGYFEIAKDKAHPFIVESKGQQVEVLGTHFNISAYGDESDVKTTLLEGSVKVTSSALFKVLKPSQQAILYDGTLRVQNVNAEDAVAWKNGLFVFQDEPLSSVMRQVKRWYDVEVIYEPGVDRNELYWGSVSRYDNVSKILEGIELTKGIHFKIEGRRITIMK